MSVDSPKFAQLADDLLTFIEQREAEQIDYGIYDVTMTGAEVLAGFHPAADSVAAEDDVPALICRALQHLAEEVHIIRFTDAEHPTEWVFRSRVAEIVRLLTKLKQRIVQSNSQKERHRVSTGKRLVADLKFTVQPRHVPRRDIPTRSCLELLSDGSHERQRAASLLLEVIEQVLPKLRRMSGFQHRTLESILKVIELDSQRGTERGVVVTASTGAGKTYAFFLPVLAKIVLERCLRGQIGVKAVCVYPRVALSENQLTDFIEILFYLNQVLERHQLPPITIGIESGAAVYQRSDFQTTHQQQQERLSKQRGWIFNDAEQGYESPFAYCVGTDGYACETTSQRLLVRPTQPALLTCPYCNKTYPFIQFARDVMSQHPPDILIATTESLNRRLLSSKYQYLSGTEQFCAPCVVMLDEIHLQTSTAGTQVALLLRRLLARIRLGKQARGDQANLAFVGLSATIAQPVQFLSELGGLPVTRISEVKPQEDEMQVVGAERFIFVRAAESEDTAVLSTLIQTAMCILHTMAQPSPHSDLPRYRTFGFVQSLDVVGRWLYQMQDAERVKDYQTQRRDVYRTSLTPIALWDIRYVPLYAYRLPPFNRQLFPAFFGPHTTDSCGCEHRTGPDPACPFFQAGECWWVLSQRGKARREPLAIKRKTGSDRSQQIEDTDDLIITTSALEVGYDDESLMCVLQYTAPTNVASFVQRKGRGGRKVGTRPLVVTVLSPYKSTDLFLFRNDHLLTNPTFHKLPLNAQNRYLQRIHGFYALFDWLCYRAHQAGIVLELQDLTRAGFAYLLDQSADQRVLLAFKDYLERTFAITDREALGQILSAQPDGLLWDHFFEHLIKSAYPAFYEHQRPGVQTRSFLHTCLPENLFSDINLPEVQVDYRPDNRGADKYLPSENISLAISETIPGNVTFRGGEGATWVPPIISDDGPGVIALSRYYELDPEPHSVNTPRISRRALRLVGIEPHRVRKLTFFRPRSIHTEQFSRDHNASFWWCNPDTGELREHRRFEEAGQDVVQLAHASAAYPISAVDITDERLGRTSPGYTLEADHPAVACDTLGQHLVKHIILYSDETANMNLLEVRRIILGSQYMIKFHEIRADELRGIVGFCRTDDDHTNCALGYVMSTEGLMLTLSPGLVGRVRLSQPLQARMRYNAIRHAFITTLTVEYGQNFFAAEQLANILLTLADLWCHTDDGTPDGLRMWWSISHDTFTRRFMDLQRTIYRPSERQEKGVLALIRDDTYLHLFLQLYSEIQADGKRFQDYLRDSFQYSLSQALKQMAQEVAGVEALNYVSAWTELHTDFADGAANSIWLYEIGMGGIGVMRATHDLLRHTPDQFWNILAHKMTRCPTAQEEALLRYILAQSADWLTTCEQLVADVINARSSTDRQQAIEVLLTTVRQHLGILLRQEHIKALLRVFIPEYTQVLDGQPLSNWRLFREINQEFLPRCVGQLGREPSFIEARAMLYQVVCDAHQGRGASVHGQ